MQIYLGGLASGSCYYEGKILIMLNQKLLSVILLSPVITTYQNSFLCVEISGFSKPDCSYRCELCRSVFNETQSAAIRVAAPWDHLHVNSSQVSNVFGEQGDGNPAVKGAGSLREVAESAKLKQDIQAKVAGTWKHFVIFHNKKCTKRREP